MLRRATLSYTELHEATKCYAVLRYASLCYAVLRSAALSYAVLLRRTTFRYAIKGVWLATPDPRSKTDGLAASLKFAFLVMCDHDARFPLLF